MNAQAVVPEEIFRKSMALTKIATLNSANFHRENFHELSSFLENIPPQK